ncbi:MAG: dihydrofolate reductase [Magnetovibrio sp.]|nr:dihydrofolate reductase [Magnetovibrio sp.]
MIRVSLIVAMAGNRAIGLDGGMPWHISADLKYFKRVTMGAPVIMGRKTYEAIGAALPGRANIVVTRNEAFERADADVVHDLEAALRKARAIAEIEGGDEVFVIGGAEIYAQALAAADRLYVTEIDGTFPGDAFFPDLPAGQWREVSREDHPPESEEGPAFSFVVLARMR